MKYLLEYYEKKLPMAVVCSDLVHSILEHEHDFVEIIYVKSGTAKHTFGDSSKIISGGDLIVVPPDISHYIKPIKSETDKKNENENFRIINIIFKEEFVDINLSCFDGQPLYIQDRKEIVFLIDQIKFEYENKKEYRVETIKGYLLSLMAMLCRLKNNNNEFKADIDFKNEYVKKAAEYIDNNYVHRIFIKEIADHIGISPRYLQKVFKECSGDTVVKYMNKLRIQRSCKMLIDTDKNVYDIAQCVGYCGTKNFYNNFKEKTGMTPNEYRENNRN